MACVVHGPLKESFLRVLHNEDNDPTYDGLPKDPIELYKELSTTHRTTIDKLVKIKLLNPDQLELLLPTNGSSMTFSSLFDITLIALMIINFTTLPPPKGGWKKMDPSDNGVSANMVRGREWRNFVNHNNADTITNGILNTKWSEGTAIIKALGGPVQDMQHLKSMSLDSKNNVLLDLLNTYKTLTETKFKNYLDSELQKLNKAVHDLQTTMDIELNQVKTTMGTKFQAHDHKLNQVKTTMDTKFQVHDHELNQVKTTMDTKLQAHDHELDQVKTTIGTKLQAQDLKLNQVKTTMDTKLQAQDHKLNQVGTKVERLENFVNKQGINFYNLY